ncbi:amelotin [Ochotona princeps]|uniref:amelotin n=1 Tax=Ochotona princeps TaxID=9978 RepID=UPI0027144FDB|nr:amelotin [Ochotona princeps]
MKTAILLFCLLGATQSLPKQLNPALGVPLPPTKQDRDQETPLKQQHPSQVFSSLSLIPLTQMLTLAQPEKNKNETTVKTLFIALQLNPAAGAATGAQTLPLTMEILEAQQKLQTQMLPIIVAQLGAQGAVLSSEELPAAPQILTGLLLHPMFTGKAGAHDDVQDEVLPTGKAEVSPATREAQEGQFSTPVNDALGVTSPVGIQRGTPPTEETTTESPKVAHRPFSNHTDATLVILKIFAVLYLIAFVYH